MKALSVMQPWANMIADGKKTIETRWWRTGYRGPLLICSSKHPSIPPAGCAIAICQLADCRPMRPDDEPAAGCLYMPNIFAWILKDIQRITPVPVRGQPGLFDVEIVNDKVYQV